MPVTRESNPATMPVGTLGCATAGTLGSSQSSAPVADTSISGVVPVVGSLAPTVALGIRLNVTTSTNQPA